MKQLSLWLPIRSIAFALVFICCAGMLGQNLDEIGCWWSVIAVVLNVLTIGLLVFLAKRNGQAFWQLINYRKSQTTWQQILGITLLVLVVGMAGMYLAGFLCYDNFLYAPPVMIAPIPKALAIINIVLLPITTTFAEDGLYLGFGVKKKKNKLLYDGRYIVYRFLSFLPLTLILCWYYYRKRNPLPIMVGHALIDLATAVQIVATSFIPGLYQTMCGL